MSDNQEYTLKAIAFLEEMVTIESLSFKEDRRCAFIESYLRQNGIIPERIGNNLIMRAGKPDTAKPTLMLNSHIDTVAAVESYSFDPHHPPLSEETIFGLGSNDAGGSVTSMLHAFLYFAKHTDVYKKLNVNLILLLTAEEERSGPNGMTKIMAEHPNLADFAIIGEPTGMKAATAERGLLVIDAQANGRSGHAARNEGINALYIAIDDIQKLRNYRFAKFSPLMGEVKMTVTQIEAGHAHNVVPDKCTFVIDVRPTDCYSNSEIMEILSGEVKSTLTARSLSNRSSATPEGHILLKAVSKMGIESYVSPTTSDWMRLTIPAIKMGPGESARSHKADEFIKKQEIVEAVNSYIDFIKTL
ncbi:MAG: M20/M25/M40 family metallo-hydrolase [Bacteroidales bacterium]|nr:M20/M25/M40 family metallo-hydrolase [Bacteroidales bacterium]